MDRCPRNQLIARIHRTSSIIFPLTLKPSQKQNTSQVVGKEKYVYLDTSFTTESACNSNE
jgi:hypothetical protein